MTINIKIVRNIIIWMLFWFVVSECNGQIQNDTLKIDVKIGSVVWIKSDVKDYYRFTVRNKKEQEYLCVVGWDLNSLELPKGKYIITIGKNRKITKTINYER